MSGRISTRLTGLILGALMLVGVASQANANLVTNGDFETGDFTGWTTSIDPVFDGVDSLAPQGGTFAAFFGNPGGSQISQTLATIAGTTYQVDFYLMIENDVLGNAIPNSFAFNWDGNTVFSITDGAGGGGYVHYSFQVLASSASTNLAFSFSSLPSFLDFDTVSVEAATQIPEPGSLALVGLAGALIAVVRRRRA
jgi:hypothetical protein